MERRTGSVLVVLASLLASAAAALPVVLLTGPEDGEDELPYGIEIPIPPVIAARDRAVSPTVRATADSAVAGTAPGIALEGVLLGKSWEENRARIRDLTTGDLRAYAIGDLLPHGSLLVGVGAGSADVLVADIEMVRLTIGGAPQLVEDFRASYEAIQRTTDQDQSERAYRAAIEDSVRTMATAGSELVQAHLDELIECGDPAVEVLIRHVADPASIAPGPYQLPAGSGVTAEPKVVGDAIIGVLESITGQTFGDPTKASEQERLEIARDWERWWGLP